jgi:hypothetical protein
MHISNECNFVPQHRIPLEQGKLLGQKPPLQPKHVWAIRTRLQLAERRRAHGLGRAEANHSLPNDC